MTFCRPLYAFQAKHNTKTSKENNVLSNYLSKPGILLITALSKYFLLVHVG
jgi:hypothetical protein